VLYRMSYIIGHFLLKNAGHFDRVIKEEMAQLAREESSRSDVDDSNVGSVTPQAIYKRLTLPEQRNKKWYARIWHHLPFRPWWDLSMMGWRSTLSCCSCRSGESSDFQSMPCFHKLWFIISRTLTLCLNLMAIYVTIICCGATYQIKRTKAKLPYVNETLYAHMNEGPVCAFDYKCGTLKTFSNEITANLANATIAHCGPCASCSSWNDLELQWSTRVSHFVIFQLLLDFPKPLLLLDRFALLYCATVISKCLG